MLICLIFCHQHWQSLVQAISFMTKLLAIAIFHIESINDGSDIDVYVTAAYELGTTGMATTHAGYLSSFSHMFWFGYFLSPIAGIFGVSQIAFSIYLTIVLTISSLLLFSAFAEQTDKNKAFIVFVILLFLATLRNAAGLVMCIAFFILFFVQMTKKFSMLIFGKFAVKAPLIIVVISVGGIIASDIQQKHCDVPEEYILNDKVLWTLYVGGSVEHSGEWNLEDSQEFNSYDSELPYDEIQQFRKDEVLTRYKELISNVSNLGDLIKQKLITIWGVFGY